MDEDSPRNINPFLLKEDLFSTYLNKKNSNALFDPWKSSQQEEFFFRPETNFLNKYFDNERLSNISLQGEPIAFKNGDQFLQYENINEDNNNIQKKPLESTQASSIVIQKANNITPDYIPKPTINSKKSKEKDNKDISDKEIKLLKNRLSARKCRLKKKTYIKQLQEEVENYRLEVAKYKNCSKKERSFENDIHIIDEQEKELGLLTHKKKREATKLEYLTNQKRLLNELFVRQIKLMMPIECKLFQNKFLKMAQFEYDDSNSVILNKIKNNIEMLNELYDFKKKPNQGSKGKNVIPYKLYMFYETLKQFTELFILNCNMI